MRRRLSNLRTVTMSFVVHVFESVDSEALVGRVTEVDSGVAKVFRSAEELVTFLRDVGSQRPVRQTHQP